ncbi:Twin-arginine translocation pathway, signal sequence, bacterial/archaeal [Burkholderiaceae bacterium]
MSSKNKNIAQPSENTLDAQAVSDRRKFIQGAGLSAVAAAAGSLIASNATAQTKNTGPRAAQPNIVFILTDNLGYGEVGCYGGGITRGAATPRIDSLAKEGTKLLNANMETQ